MTDTYLDPSAAAGEAVQSLARLVVAVALPAVMDELTQQAEQFNRTIAIQQETIGNQSRRMTGHGLQLKELRKTVERLERELELQKIERERLEMRLNLTTVKANRMEGLISEDRRFMASVQSVVNFNADAVAAMERGLSERLDDYFQRLEGWAQLTSWAWEGVKELCDWRKAVDTTDGRQDTALTELESRTADLESVVWEAPSDEYEVQVVGIAEVQSGPIAGLSDDQLISFLKYGTLPTPTSSARDCDKAGHCWGCCFDNSPVCCCCGEIL